MLHTCVVTGTLARKEQPLQGLIRFTPKRLWVMQRGTAYACLAPEVRLDEDGSFAVWLTATDSDAIHWRYQVEVDRWRFEIDVPWSENGHSLRELMHERHPGPRSPH